MTTAAALNLNQDAGSVGHGEWASSLERLAPLAGRGLLSAIFLMSALGKLGNFQGTADMMAAKGFPIAPLFLAGAIALELGGGLSVLAGFKARWGAVALIVFLIPTTLTFHNFWAYSGKELEGQMIHFMKNLAILGGLVMTWFFGSGPYSLARRST